MPKPVSRHFKAAITQVKLKATPVLEEDEVIVDDAQIVVTLRLAATKPNVRLMDFLNGAKSQKTVDVSVESAQLELYEI